MSNKLSKLGKYLLPAGLLALAAALFLLGASNIDKPAVPAKNGSAALPEPKDAVVLYTNDVHCAVDAYPSVAALRASLSEDGLDVFVADGGDNLQGGTVGAYTRGEAVVALMNAVPYSAAAPGNHDFDYGTEFFLKLLKKMNYDEISANVEDARTGKLLLPPYKMATLGNRKVAFVGATTPETYVKANPSFFTSEDGKPLYAFNEKKLCEKVQSAVDAARAEGAQTVILLSHLGANNVVPEWAAPAVIAGTRGIDAVLDAHSHETVAGEKHKNADGKDVLYAQTGTKLMNIGKLTISKDGALSFELVRPADVDANKSDAVKKAHDDVQALIEANRKMLAFLEEKVAVAEIPLTADDPRTGTRRVRVGGSNLGDFCADAYRAVTGAQIAVVNGGGLRASVEGGDVTRRALMDVNPWNDAMCVVEMTGQAILDILEFNSRSLPDVENGGFCHVSGMSYEVNAAVPSPAKADEKGAFAGFEEGKPRRVVNARVDGMPIDPAAVYTVAGSKFYLLDGGDGVKGIDGVRLVAAEGLPDDASCLVKYVTEHLKGRIPMEQYGNPLGAGRVVIRK